MTVWDILRACLRRWYIVCIGLTLTLSCAVYVTEKPGVYWAQTDVLFLPPTGVAQPNRLANTSASLVATAGVIEREINAGRPMLRANGPDVTIVDLGVNDGVMVRLPNYGGQWANNFSQPELQVQASGSSAQVVKERVDRSVTAISGSLTRRQDQADVQAGNRITLISSPQTLQIHYALGDRRRALLVSVVLGLFLTMAAAATTERVRHTTLVTSRTAELLT